MTAVFENVMGDHGTNVVLYLNTLAEVLGQTEIVEVVVCDNVVGVDKSITDRKHMIVQIDAVINEVVELVDDYFEED